MEKSLTLVENWSLFDYISEGVIIAELNGAIQYMNQAVWGILGLSRNVLSLAELYEEVNAKKAWQDLLNAGQDVELYVPSAKVLLRSLPCHLPYDCVQILVQSTSKPETSYLRAFNSVYKQVEHEENLQPIVDELYQLGWRQSVLILYDTHYEPILVVSSGFNKLSQPTPHDYVFPADAWHHLFNQYNPNHIRWGHSYFAPGNSKWSKAYVQNNLAVKQGASEDLRFWQPYDLVCLSLHNEQKQWMGLIILDKPQNNYRPNKDTLHTLDLYAQFASTTIEKFQEKQKTKNRIHDLELMFAAGHAFSGTLEKDAILNLMARHLLQAIDADAYSILQWESNNQTMVILEERVYGLQRNALPAGTILSLTDDPTWNEVITTSEPLVIYASSSVEQTTRTPDWFVSDQAFTKVILPIFVSEELFALVEIFKLGKQKTLGQRELNLLQVIVSDASRALETAFIFEDTYEREIFYNALGTVTLALNYTLEIKAVLDLICNESLRIFNVNGAYIWLRDGDKFFGSAAKGHKEGAFIGRTVSVNDKQRLVIQIADSGQAIYVNNFQEAYQTTGIPDEKTIQAILGVPLAQEGNVIGVLVLIDKNKARRFSEKYITQASIFGVQAAIAVQNAHLFEDLRRFNEELDLRVAERTHALNEESTRVKILLRITSELSASLDQDRVLNQALQLVNEVVNATQGVIMLIDQETGDLIFRAAFGMTPHQAPMNQPSGLMRDEGLAGWMIENVASVVVHDTNDDPRWVRRETSSDIRSVLAVPLVTSEEVMGVLMLFHTRPNAFTKEQLDLVEAAASQVSNAINNANFYLLIRDQAERLGTLLQETQVEAAKNQAILESIADGVLFADHEGNITLANMAIGSILDIPKDQLLGRSVNELMGVYSHSAHSWLSIITNWSQVSVQVPQWTVQEDRFEIEDKVIIVRLSPVFVGRQFFGTVSIFRDVTKEVEVDKLKSEFVSTVSHELRTPMTSIKGYADLMLMGAAGSMSGSQTKYLQVIKNNADRLHNLVNDLLDISRIETGKKSLDLRPLDINQLVDKVVEEHMRGLMQHEDKHIELSINLPDMLPLVNADEASITQTLTNLLDNAYNYTPENGKVKIGAKVENEFVYVSVSDTGIGISQENLDKIFDRFFRGEHQIVQQVRGTGLGLPIVRSLVEMHGGQLKVDSIQGSGSIFTFNLPIVKEDEDNPA